MKQTGYSIFWGVVLALSGCGAGAGTQSESLPAAQADTAALLDLSALESYGFVALDADTVYDPAGNLARFYAKLHALGSPSDPAVDPAAVRRVSIVHFGDSHLQGGTMPEAIMRSFHLRFGSAGRGMIVPHRLGGSNEPRDYTIRTVDGPERWPAVRVNSRGASGVGVTGVALHPPQANNKLQIAVLRNAWTDAGPDYAFDRVRIFHGKYAPIIQAPDSLVIDSGLPESIHDFDTEIRLAHPVDSLCLITRPDGRFGRGPIYGFSLENGRSGVLYHALGVNGASFAHWAGQAEVVRQSVALEPDLILLSLGSNDAAGSPFVESVFYAQVDRFVGPLRAANPGASIVLTAPPEAYRRGVPNPNFGRVSAVLRRYAAERGVACIDLYGITGGAGSAEAHAAAELLGRDKIHYTPAGYRLQGLLIYHALCRGYTQLQPQPHAAHRLE